jgi:hypothetical protein
VDEGDDALQVADGRAQAARQDRACGDGAAAMGAGEQAQDERDEAQGGAVGGDARPPCPAALGGRGGGGQQDRDKGLQQDQQQNFHRGRSSGVGTRGLLSGGLGLGCGVLVHVGINN